MRVRVYVQTDGFVQESRNAIVNALDLCLSSTNPSKLSLLSDVYTFLHYYTSFNHLHGIVRRQPSGIE